jgi:dTDP-4-dehydrorhamnose reductase
MSSKNILITGADGQLGMALRSQYAEARFASKEELDITDPSALEAHDWKGVDTIINAAAYTKVDEAETPEGRVAAWRVNAAGVQNLARIALEHSLTLVHISTDYVFDGTREPHAEDEPLTPLGVYGASKAAGDIAAGLAPQHYILRTSWVIGEGKNFVRTMLGLGAKGIAPKVVADQTGRLTFASELARAIDHLLKSRAPYGTHNASNGGEPASWADITRAIFKEAGFDLKVTDTTTAEYFAGKDGIAPRPLNSTLDLSKLERSGFSPRDWREDLSAYIKKELSL